MMPDLDDRRIPASWPGRDALPTSLRLLAPTLPILLGLLLALMTACRLPTPVPTAAPTTGSTMESTTASPAAPTAAPATVAAATLPATISPTARVRSTRAAPAPTGPASPSEGEAMLLTILFDNNPHDPALRTGWGFAAWLEYGGQTVLLDTGADGAILLENMAALDLDPEAVDVVVLSHDHGDHTGGLDRLLEANAATCAGGGKCVTVYVPAGFPARARARARSAGATVVEVDAALEILPGVWSTGPVGSGLVEQALVVETSLGLLVVTGCAHPGADRMVARAQEVAGGQVHLVVGGFHLGGASRARLDAIVAEFRRLGVEKVAPCHCTGDEAREVFRAAYGDDFYASGAGWQWQDQPPPSWRPTDQGIAAQKGIAAVAVVRDDPCTLYLAVYEPGGLYRSDDGGHTWQPANHGLEGIAPLSIAVHPEDPDLAWAGTVLGGYRTADGGQSWQPVADLPSVPLYALAVTPDGRTLYAGGAQTGVWRSDDGGQAWQLAQGDDGPQTILTLSPTPDGGVLAGTAGQGLWFSADGRRRWERAPGLSEKGHVQSVVAMGDGLWYALTRGRLYRWVDDGEKWQSIGPPGFEALSFSPEPCSDGRLYLGSKGNGLALSADGGQSWKRVEGELRHADITSLAADPAVPGRLYLGTRYNGLYCSEDGGGSWSLLTAALGRPLIAALAQDPARPQVYYAGALDGLYRSDDGGERWSLVSDEMGSLNVQAVAVGPTGEQVYAGAHSGLYVSRDAGATWQLADDTAGISIFTVVVDPRDADRVYAGSWGHNVLVSTDAGRTWASIHGGLETLSVHAFALDPADPQRMYAGTVEGVYRSADGGQTWLAAPLADRPLSVLALLVDPGEPARVYAGTTEGVYLSVDRGRTWRPAGHDSLDATVTALALDQAPLPAILAGTEHHSLHRSTDGGESWEPCGLEAASIYAVLVDRAGTVWLGTDQGVFREP